MSANLIQYCQRCEKKVAKFMIYRIRTKEWLAVCGTCDSEIGIQNLVACGYSRKEAVQINRATKGVKP